MPDGVPRVGFAAETGADLDQAEQKPARRGFHLPRLNDVARPGSGFEVDTNKVWILDAAGVRTETDTLPKHRVAHLILDEVAAVLRTPVAES